MIVMRDFAEYRVAFRARQSLVSAFGWTAHNRQFIVRSMSDARYEDYIPKRSPHVLTRGNPEGIYSIMRLDDQRFYQLDGIAGELWSMMDGTTPLREILSRLRSKHRPPEDLFERDVSALLSELETEGLIES